MARPSANSILNSLKGKIWLATSALAFFICTFGLISYLLVSFVTGDMFYAVFVPFLFLGFIVMVFGWWLSNEVVSPIERVTLLAKSMERGILSNLPRTSGSTETDELLQTLQRSSQQLQIVVNLMDKAAGGRLDIALSPLESNDRLTNSFQKLLGRVSDSIYAKQDLERVQAALQQINEAIASLKNGNLDVEIKADCAETKEISDGLKYLVRELNDLTAQVRNGAAKTRISATEVRKTLAEIIQQNEIRVQNLNSAEQTFKRLPGSVKKISEDLSQSAISAHYSIEKAEKGIQLAQENLSAVGALRDRIREAVKRLRQLNERSHDLNKASKAVTDLAHRTNLIALNASIQTVEVNNSGNGFLIIAEEMKHLADRAGDTNKYISSLNKTILAETVQIERLLEESVGEMANISKFVIETENSLDEITRNTGQFLNLQEQIVAYTRENNHETETAFQVFINSIAETENTVAQLKQSETNLAQLLSASNNPHAVTADFTASAPEMSVPETSVTEAPENEFHDLAGAMEQELVLTAEGILPLG